MATKLQLEELIKDINKNLIRDDIELRLSPRYGSMVIDIGYKGSSNIESMLVAGLTKNEMLEYLWAMYKGAKLIKNY